MITQTYMPAVIASLTTFLLFILKDLIISIRQRKIFAKLLLIHYLRTLSRILDMPSSDIEYIKPSNLEQYIDIYIKYKPYNDALDVFLEIYLYWKNGSLAKASRHIIDNFKAKLSLSINNVEKIPISVAGDIFDFEQSSLSVISFLKKFILKLKNTLQKSVNKEK